MELTGRIFKVLAPTSGKKKNGDTWYKQEFVIETEGEYSQKIPFQNLSGNLNNFNLRIGDLITVHFNINGSEYQDKHYVNLMAYKIT